MEKGPRCKKLGLETDPATCEQKRALWEFTMGGIVSAMLVHYNQVRGFRKSSIPMLCLCLN